MIDCNVEMSGGIIKGQIFNINVSVLLRFALDTLMIFYLLKNNTNYVSAKAEVHTRYTSASAAIILLAYFRSLNSLIFSFPVEVLVSFKSNDE